MKLVLQTYRVSMCQGCKEVMEEPMKLPCDHNLCGKCVILTDYTNNRICPQCKTEYRDRDPKPIALDRYNYCLALLY